MEKESSNQLIFKSSNEKVREALFEVMDPEIPNLSIVDLGIVTKIEADDNRTKVVLTPTFAGCPALKIIEKMVLDKLIEKGFPNPEVSTSFAVKWTTNLITEKGKEQLKKHGLAPPPKSDDYIELDVLSDTPCPFCNSRNTELKSLFGATLCRTIHYCNNCRQGFEGFKPLV